MNPMGEDLEPRLTDETGGGSTGGAEFRADPMRMTSAPHEEIRRAIESIVLVATEPVPLELLSQLLERPHGEIERICDDLAEEYRARSSGFELVLVAGGYRYQTVADTAPYVERFILDEQRARLSGAALETLAIVAYKQPISRAQIASIRGVDPDGVLRTLSARGYVAEVGRDDGPGQAVLFGTTQLFCEKLGLSSLDELPPIAEFIPEAAVVEALEAGLRIDPIGPGTPSGGQ
jgi:segregation and condensation protein B